MSKRHKQAKVAANYDALLSRNLFRLETQIGDVQRAVQIAALMVGDPEHRAHLGVFATEEAEKLADKLWTSFQDACRAASDGKEWDDTPAVIKERA